MEKFYCDLKSDVSLELGEFNGLEEAVEFARSKYDNIEEVYGKECVWSADSEQIFLRATEVK